MSSFPSFEYLCFRSRCIRPFAASGVRLLTSEPIPPVMFVVLLVLQLASASAGLNEQSSSSSKPKVDAATYYLLQRVTLTTDSGVHSVPPGSEVHLVQRVQGGMKVKLADGAEIVMAANALTQDADRAQQVTDEDRGAAAAAAAEARARAEARTAEETARREKEVAAAQDYLRKAQVTTVPDATPRPSGLIGSALDQKPQVTRSRKRK